jgi:hypothetical protein
MMQLVRPTNQPTDKRVALGEVGILPPVKKACDEIRSQPRQANKNKPVSHREIAVLKWI